VLVAGLGAAAHADASLEGEARLATGSVFEDGNRNGRRDPGERGVPSVAVSNGRDVVRTDSNGRYRIPIGEDAILFAVKPSGWATPQTRDRIPLFYYVHKPKGSPPGLAFPGVEPTGPLPESVDFPLARRVERSRFRVILFGDTQTYTLEEVDIFARDIIEELIGADVAFGISLGDVVGDNLSLLDPVNGAVSQIGVPWYNVHGNHDMNLRAESDAHADETWERVYGPTTYAFEYGPVHFIVLDDVIYQGANPEGGSPGSYAGGLTPGQLAFIREYLAGVPREHLVVLAMHIPLALPDTLEVPDNYQVPQRRELFEILSGHPHTFSISAHMHVQYQQFFGPEHGYRASRPHHHLVHATASGSWWLGEPDELGIPHATMRCGAPNGYSIISFDGNRYSVRFKAARRPAGHQMHVVAPREPPDARRRPGRGAVGGGGDDGGAGQRLRGLGALDRRDAAWQHRGVEKARAGTSGGPPLRRGQGTHGAEPLLPRARAPARDPLSAHVGGNAPGRPAPRNRCARSADHRPLRSGVHGSPRDPHRLSPGKRASARSAEIPERPQLLLHLGRHLAKHRRVGDPLGPRHLL
jgi:hypothetical protein